MPAMTMVQAINSGLDVLLGRDPDVLIFGEDVGFYGGVFRITEGLQKKYGEQRVFDTPIAEGGMLATAVGMGAVVREGGAVTVLTYGTMVHVAIAAADETGIDAEIVDLRSLLPLDIDTVVDSVKKTGRCVIAHEATRTCGYGAELAALVQEHCFYHLEAPIVRVTGWDTPYPHIFEWEYFPGPQRVAEGMRRALEG